MSFFGIGMNRSFEDMVLYYKMTGVVDVRLMPKWMVTDKNPLDYLTTGDSYLRRKNQIKSDTLGMKTRHELVNNCKCVACSHELCSQKNLVVSILKILDEDDMIVPGNEDDIFVNDGSPVDYSQNKIIDGNNQNISTREHKKWLKWCDDQLKKDYWRKFDVKLTIRGPVSKSKRTAEFKGRKFNKPAIKYVQKTETESEFEFDSECGSLFETISDPDLHTKFVDKSEISSDSQFESKSESSSTSSDMIQR